MIFKREFGMLRFLPLLAAGLAMAKPADITYHRDVLPILQKRCQGCHRPGEAAPMSFLTYKDARPWAKAMREAVTTRKMPPWFADPQHGKFANDRSLSQPEIDTLVAWAENGAKEGDKKHAPKPLEWVEGWQIGKPDQIFEMPTEFEVPASGTIEYQHFILPTGFTEDRWISAIEARPGNRALLHHAVVFVRPPQSKWIREAKPGAAFVPGRDWRVGVTLLDEVLDTYVPGAIPHKLEPGQAKMIPAGSDLVFQLHYTANGKAGTDRSRIGVIFAKEPPKERVYTINISNSRFTIPPGAPAHPVEGRMMFRENARLVGLSPHMHLRGRSMMFTAVFPDGEKKVLLDVPRYDFSWQLYYYVAEQMPLPKGTRVEVVATFDNSPNNPRNPDATKEVRWGDQSWQEMMVGFMDVAIDAKMDPMDLFRPRPASSGAE
jgi:hypothetical protein